ncbi:DNA recombination protein RmuC [Ruminococcus sp.]|uniref:DNA recombination protein RmuC n=1 Tax=Ruminococcus sp. TaxID=41978 RepID=UPI0025F83988|nr:DNA recombination protein RmuC [Ruminococcus sp.]
MDIVIIIIGIITIIMLAVILIKMLMSNNEVEIDVDRVISAVKDGLNSSQRDLREEMTGSVQANVRNMGEGINNVQKAIGNSHNEKLMAIERQITEVRSDTDKKLTSIQQVVDEKLQTSLAERMNTFGQLITDNQKQSGKALNDSLINLENRFKTLETTNNEKLESMRRTMLNQLSMIQEENQKKLDVIQKTVNEKLEAQLNKSFSLVSERLEKVYTSLGEMQSIAAGVGDLKKVLTNVKTRGILGEIQLGNILEEILAPEMYDTEVPTIPGSSNRVEFAVKLPGQGEGEHVYLPIDSKFPGDTYSALQDAYDSGNKEEIVNARKNLETVIKKCAADIKSKYVSPPNTTNFGIMFLPFEGLYAEVVKLGLIDVLQRDYSISITGPSTMAAMLNSLQMGFRTLAIQKRSSEVWNILGTVKKEFSTFSEVLEKTQKHIRQVDDDLEKLIGTRTRQINRSLSKVEVIDNSDDYKVESSDD